MPILEQFDNKVIFKNELKRNIFHLAALGAGYLNSEPALDFSLLMLRSFNAMEYFKEYLEDDRFKEKITEKDVFGKTPLDYAIESGNDALIIYLLTQKELKSELLNKLGKVSITVEEIQQLPQYKNPDKLGQSHLNDKLEIFVDGVERAYDLHTICMKPEQWSNEEEMLSKFNKEYSAQIPLLIKLENSREDEFFLYGNGKDGNPQLTKLNLKHHKELPVFGSLKKLTADSIPIEIFHEIALSQSHFLPDGSGRTFIDHLGMCHGWTFLAHIYFAAGKVNQFNEIRRVLAKWNGTKEDLNGPLPDSLQRHYKDQKDLMKQLQEKSGIFEDFYKKYPDATKFLGMHEDGKAFLTALLQKRRDPKSLEALSKEYGIQKEDLLQLFDEIFDRYQSKEDLFRQLINDLSIFHITEAVDNLKLESGLREEERQKQYEMVKDNSLGRSLKQLFVTQPEFLSKTQLAQYFKLFSFWPSVSIDIGCYPSEKREGHTIGIDMTSNGKFKYFDSNLESDVEIFDTPEELANHIFNSVFKKFDWIKDNKARIEFWIGKFYDKDEPVPELITGEREKINYKYPDGKTLLMQAFETRASFYLIKALLDAGSNPAQTDDRGRSALFYALEYQADPSIIQDLLKKRTNLNVEDKSGKTLLMYAFEYGAPQEILATLLKSCDLAAVDDQGKSVLTYALEAVATEQILLNILEKTNVRPKASKTPLMTALEYGAPEKIVHLLLNMGSDLSRADREGKTVLMYALEHNASEKVIELLLDDKNKLDLNQIDNQGKTALMRLVTQHPLNIIGLERLLTKGPGVLFSGRLDLEKTDQSKFTALQLAVKSGNGLAAEMLIKAGAKIPKEGSVYVSIAERAKLKLDERIKKAKSEQVVIQQEKQQRDKKFGLAGRYARDLHPLPRKPTQPSPESAAVSPSSTKPAKKH